MTLIYLCYISKLYAWHFFGSPSPVLRVNLQTLSLSQTLLSSMQSPNPPYLWTVPILNLPFQSEHYVVTQMSWLLAVCTVPPEEGIGCTNEVCLMEWHLCWHCLEWHQHCLELHQCLNAIHQEALYALLRQEAQEIVAMLWNTQCKYSPLCMPVCLNADHFSLSQSLVVKLQWFLTLPTTLHRNIRPVQNGSIVPTLKGKHIYNTCIRTSQITCLLCWGTSGRSCDFFVEHFLLSFFYSC